MRKPLVFYIFISLFLMFSANVRAKDVVWFDGSNPITYSVEKDVELVVKMALDMFCDDMRQVTGVTPVKTKKATIRIIQGKGKNDGFRITVKNGQIILRGDNARGTAYAILELSRMAGVSPWIWWGDVVPEKKRLLTLPDGFTTYQRPSVEYRGIFINDEDWSTRPWSRENEDSATDNIGVQTYKRIFQLLLRLRANAFWPAMHPGTTAFFRIPGAKQMADSFAIVIGTSHCEPLLRNNVGEWDVNERGRFNYRTNRQAVQDYWTERLREVKASQNNMFTIGMRGIHDSSMEGYETMEEKFNALQQVIDDQQSMLRECLGNPNQLMQVFVPYKEVLQLYEMGLRVPDNVTLMWCDDNYGYITRLPDDKEQLRKGGGGIYYHLSYWGRPHDYLWLTTTQPGLIYHQMRQAYDHQVRKLWIANVHDPKVAGYDLELFLDMAWDIHSVTEETLENHYRSWLCRQFGQQIGNQLFPVMHEFYRLCGQRKPEFMGWNQVELDKKIYERGLGPVRDTEFSLTEFDGELDRYLDRFNHLAEQVETIEGSLSPELQDAYFAVIKYPVTAAAAHATKLLEAQKARYYWDRGQQPVSDEHLQLLVKTSVAKSLAAYQKIKSLTLYYNNVMAGGKWHNSMSDHPRDLPVFGIPPLPIILTDKEIQDVLNNTDNESLDNPFVTSHSSDVIAQNAASFNTTNGHPQLIQMLGHSMCSIALSKGDTVTYTFDIDEKGDYILTTALIPTQPNGTGDIRYSVTVDNQEPVVFSLKEPFRSEQWKLNVQRGQTLRQQSVTFDKGRHQFTIQALDHNIILDQWILDSNPQRNYYLIPVDF